MAKLLDKYENIPHETTYVTSEYWNRKVYESDQNSKEIKIKVDNKSVHKIPNFGYLLTVCFDVRRNERFTIYKDVLELHKNEGEPTDDSVNR